MTDLVVFAGMVGVIAVLGVFVGIIVAGRIDRIMAPGPRSGVGEPGEEEHQP